MFLTAMGVDTRDGSKVDLDASARSRRKVAAAEREKRKWGISHWEDRDKVTLEGLEKEFALQAYGVIVEAPDKSSGSA